jgi:hypothetical protein
MLVINFISLFLITGQDGDIIRIPADRLRQRTALSSSAYNTYFCNLFICHC